MRPEPAPRPGAPAQPREAILLVALAAINTGIALRCVEPMLPQLAAEFGIGVPAAGSIITMYGIAYAAAVLIAGPLGDRYGKLRVVTFGMVGAAAASFGCALSWSLGSLGAMRLFAGVFGSTAMALGMAYIGDVVPAARRQTTIAYFVSGSLLGQTLGPLVGGVFTDWTGWRVSFAVLGAAFLVVAVILFVRTAAEWPAPVPGRFAPLATHRMLLSRPPVRRVVGTGIAETVFFFGPYAFLGAFLKWRFELSYTAIGLILAGFGAGGLLYTAMVRWLLRKLGERGLVHWGGMLGAVLFAVIAAAPHWAWTVPCTIGLGVAFYMVHNTIQMKATEVAPDARGAAVALYASAWGGGQALGAALMGAAVAAFDYTPMIIAFGLAWALLGVWLRGNLVRLAPSGS